jgi:hypothetical protein
MAFPSFPEAEHRERERTVPNEQRTERVSPMARQLEMPDGRLSGMISSPGVALPQGCHSER